MKKALYIILITALFSFTWTALATETPNDVINFSDENLEAVIRERLSIPDGQNITQADVLQIDTFTVNKKNISDISGLEYFTNLWNLNLSSNNIIDVIPFTN